MKKMIAKKFYESKQVEGMLSTLCNLRDNLNSYTNSFEYAGWREIEKAELFRDEDRLYAVENASGKRFEISDEAQYNAMFKE